jgi:Fanconi anemia group M protein
MRRKSFSLLFIIEGNPFLTKHHVSREAIKGALLSISAAWQIPIVFSKDQNQTTELLIMLGNQMLQDKLFIIRKGNKPKKLKNQQLYFLQGIPDVGPALAHRLIVHFGSLKKIMLANEKQFLKVNGIGKTKALKIVEFINKTFE